MKLLAMALSLSFASFVICADARGQVRGIELPDSSQTVSAEEQVLQRDLNYLLAPIKSARDLKRYLTETNESPLDMLSPGAKARFVDSLTFSKRGLSGFRYDDLEGELTPSQIYRVLALFGQQHNAPFLERARVETELDRSILGMEAHRKCFGPYQSPDGCGLDFLEDYKCESPGTCIVDNLRACTDNC